MPPEIDDDLNYLMKGCIDWGRTVGIDVSICGEMAAEPKYTLLLLGMGVRTLSLAPIMIPEIKKVIRSISISECEQVAKTALEMDMAEDVIAFLVDKIRPLLPELFK